MAPLKPELDRPDGDLSVDRADGDLSVDRADGDLSVDPSDVGLDPGRLARLDEHFRRYVDDGLLPGWVLAVSRHGHLAHVAAHGQRDLEAGLPAETDTIWRIFSMTKPITAVAALVLWERGGFELNEPVRRFIPSFRDLRVWRGGSSVRPETEPVTEELRVWHLFTHTSGLTYGFMQAHPVDALYRAAGFEWGVPPEPRPGRRVRPAGLRCRCCSSPARSGTTG